ncbi:MAG: GNAT family N-acetyltransferase [Butyrivibrio sp.]|jgi:RimJ/RimL family protein N-acetyltransferase|uniref:GNAT family N-acetyltransferase n=1 Tax=Butyrivibrio sp. TaxID=28121 RepID=UPI001EBD25D7|nr:GNAT family N-acetyltransferase [Butyrivibrio sp.]MBE5841246.1 GNAT family N-acetyltransferase [Butyrivibrio sp.]MCR4756638.1 GNAT family N-acetyltransferase [Butyrivibrio sp.]
MKIKEQQYTLPTGEIVTIKSAGPEDAEKVKLLRETTARETHFMAREPEDGQMNIDRLTEGLKMFEESDKSFMVNAYIGDELVGDLGVALLRPHIKYLHRAYLGMSILQKCTGMGLGSAMMKIALEQAKANGFEQVELGVFSDNERAQALYKKFGFKEYGKQPRAFKLQDGTYRDEIIMVNIFE